jgi:hypothetical protein
MTELIIISLFIVLWLFLTFIMWYLYHIIVAKDDPYEEEMPFFIALITMPVIWIPILLTICTKTRVSNLENKILARIDRFFDF